MSLNLIFVHKIKSKTLKIRYTMRERKRVQNKKQNSCTIFLHMYLFVVLNATLNHENMYISVFSLT